jgi:hypothetical protein
LRRIALALLAILAGCDQPATKADVQEIADRAAVRDPPDDSALQVRVAQLEAQVAALQRDESKDINVLAEITAADAKESAARDAELARLGRNEKVWKTNLDFLLARQGLAPIPETK